MNCFLTSKENIALDLIFDSFEERRINRTMEEYIAIAARAPKLSALHADINLALQEMAIAGRVPYEICYFKAGDKKRWYEKFPVSVSIEVVRQAWVKSGMRGLQIWQKQHQLGRRKLLIFWPCFGWLELQ